MRNRILVALFVVAVFSLCFWRGQEIPLKDQLPLYEGLRNTAGIIFAVMGAWLAILYPVAFQKFAKPGQRELSVEEETQVKRLFHPLVCSTVVLGFAVFALFAVPLAKTFVLSQTTIRALRGISFGSLGLMTAMQIWTVILTLVPTDMLKQHLDEMKVRVKKVRALTEKTQTRNRPDKR